MTQPALPHFISVTQLSLAQILTEIVSECQNGCTDVRSTFEHFARLKKANGAAKNDQGTIEFSRDELTLLGAFVDSLNFAGIRERQEFWNKAIKIGIR